MAAAIGYQVEVGGQRAGSGRGGGDRQLLSLRSELSLDGVGGRCALELGGTDEALPGVDDDLTVELDGGDGLVRVFTGRVEAAESTPTSQRVLAGDGLSLLAQLDLETAYEDVAVDFIVKDVLQQAGLDPGTVAAGPKLPSYVLHHGPRALRHLQRLAELCGVDLFVGREGKVHFTGPKDGGADHSFAYGERVQSLSLSVTPPLFDGIELWGEGAASSQGADKYYWLPADLSSVSGKAAIDDGGSVSGGKAGSRTLHVRDGAVRTGEVAAKLAEARMKAVAARGVQGHLKVDGYPAVAPGDLVEITGLPDGHSAAAALAGGRLLGVRRVVHVLDVSQGFVTRMEF